MVISIVCKNRNCHQKASLDVVLNVSGRVIVVSITVKMELFSLEDEEDYGDIFITQSPKVQEVGNDGNFAKDRKFLGLDRNDFQSPCASILDIADGNAPYYSDISDDEMPPSSQMEVDQPNFE